MRCISLIENALLKVNQIQRGKALEEKKKASAEAVGTAVFTINAGLIIAATPAVAGYWIMGSAVTVFGVSDLADSSKRTGNTKTGTISQVVKGVGKVVNLEVVYLIL